VCGGGGGSWQAHRLMQWASWMTACTWQKLLEHVMSGNLTWHAGMKAGAKGLHEVGQYSQRLLKSTFVHIPQGEKMIPSGSAGLLLNLARSGQGGLGLASRSPDRQSFKTSAEAGVEWTASLSRTGGFQTAGRRRVSLRAVERRRCVSPSRREETASLRAVERRRRVSPGRREGTRCLRGLQRRRASSLQTLRLFGLSRADTDGLGTPQCPGRGRRP